MVVNRLKCRDYNQNNNWGKRDYNHNNNWGKRGCISSNNVGEKYWNNSIQLWTD